MTDVLGSFFQHAAITHGVTVRVSVNFWVYHIRIEYNREDTIHLITRHWRIVDARGMINLVDGEGVVGETPVLAPGQTHDYVSGCPLATPHGSMEGFYTFRDGTGETFEARIPFFPLAAPAEAR